MYAEGYDRVGCVGCPLASTKKKCAELARFPKYKNLYLIAFRKYIENRIANGFEPIRDNVGDLWHWWMEDGVLPGQINMFEEQDGAQRQTATSKTWSNHQTACSAAVRAVIRLKTV